MVEITSSRSKTSSVQKAPAVLPVTLLIPLDHEEAKTKEVKSLKVNLFREMPLARQIQVMLYQAKIFKTLDSLLNPENPEDNPTTSGSDKTRYSLFYGETDLSQLPAG